MTIEKWNAGQDGPLSEAGFRRKLEARGYACAVYTYPRGTVFPMHAHTQDKIDGVLRGRFLIRMDGADYLLEAGDCIAVPRGRLHSAEVLGDDAVVSIDAVRD